MAQNDVRRFDVVVIGGSAGSLDIILQLIARMPTDSGATFIIVVHRKNDPDSLLEDLLAARTAMRVREIEDKDPIYQNTVYIAPADYHLLLENRFAFSLDSSDKIHFSRPSIDVTFENVAQTYGTKALGILLSGANADGADGLKRIRDAGGYTIVQDPDSAEVGFMPQQAINNNSATEIVSALRLPDAVIQMLCAI